MNNSANPIEKISINNHLNLSYLESAVLKIHALGYSNSYTMQILEMKKEQLSIIIQDILFKYQTIDLFQTISLAINCNHLNRYDLVKDEVKKLALRYSSKSHAYFSKTPINNTSQFNNTCQEKIEHYLTQFLCDVKKEFIKNSTLNQGFTLDSEELYYCTLKLKSYKSINFVEINRVLRPLGNIEELLKLKLQTTNFFNTIRKIFELGICDHTKFSTKYSQFEKKITHNTKSKIFSINEIEKYSDKEKQLVVYYTLIDYYSTLEDIILFK